MMRDLSMKQILIPFPSVCVYTGLPGRIRIPRIEITQPIVLRILSLDPHDYLEREVDRDNNRPDIC